MPLCKLKARKNKGDGKDEKMIALIVLLLTVTSCSELAELEAGHQQRMRERGMRCRYNYKGELQHCGYIN
ncbi:hypothetical protein [Leptotrichia sp. oral taxon 879]|uniref:hypothetical protein n=1 Tax=Leptotrichia sp. oral taxon 879 TaxID=1227267 RepID=UPI0003AE2621|nr:hypothetical protein [Leptotrichia sp. oral taxon 879]ERK47416.1 hypothetical protein HMPREF1552_02413 [Leptotrichia sp. oral taxon 879 str. F0557]